MNDDHIDDHDDDDNRGNRIASLDEDIAEAAARPRLRIIRISCSHQMS